MIIGVLAVVAALVGVHWYVWRRMVRDTTRPGGLPRRIGTGLVVLLPVLTVTALVSTNAGVPFTLQRIVAWPGYLWLAVLLYLVLALVVGEAVRPLLTRFLARRAAGPPPEEIPEPVAAVPGAAARTTPDDGPATPSHSAPDSRTPDTPAPDGPASRADDPRPPDEPALSRRLFVSRVVAVGAATAAAGTVGYGTYSVLRGPSTRHVTVPLAKLPRAAHGFRIAVVSDIHLGPILGRGHAQRVVDAVNRTGADLITVVGDLVDGTVANLGSAAAPLRELRARHGAFFVTGNHEYFSGAEEWVDYVRELGIHPLENARVELPAFDLAGVNDFAGESDNQGPDFARALGDRDTSRASVLLAHQPVAVHDAVDYGVDLQLSGHTHGGQLWPGPLLAELANPTVAGLERYGDTQLYVTRGAGAWGPPVRVGAPSDITVVELASKQA
ncbi:metallophosphoesterase [Yinghuangia sp. ASG 101]|nr:metallophosphoesterase [Yinghuangia sp. ASG 101]UGQ15603.1 metallophosphoesterase [Yinghuangia sp. ASG 101]